VLRDLEGYALEAIASATGVSNRQASRDYREAIDELIELLWQRIHQSDTLSKDEGATSVKEEEPYNVEVAVAAANVEVAEYGTAALRPILEEVLATAVPFAQAHGVLLELICPDDLPALSVSTTLLRQGLLSLLLGSITTAPGNRLRFKVNVTPQGVQVNLVQLGQSSVPREPANLESSQDVIPDDLKAVGQQLLVAQGATVEIPAANSALIFSCFLPLIERYDILVVDDNADLVQLFRRYLHGQPYRVLSAYSGTEAMTVARERKPSVILIDLLMPHQDGWETFHRLRSDPVTATIPVVICSVLPEQPLAATLGVNGFLPKPVSQVALQRMLAHCCGVKGVPANRRQSNEAGRQSPVHLGV
jgi:CheY-like chemotaxis protein